MIVGQACLLNVDGKQFNSGCVPSMRKRIDSIFSPVINSLLFPKSDKILVPILV